MKSVKWSNLIVETCKEVFSPMISMRLVKECNHERMSLRRFKKETFFARRWQKLRILTQGVYDQRRVE